MPLHFYGVEDGSKLEALKPFVNVMVETNHGREIYWCLDRKDAIEKVKVELATSLPNTNENSNKRVKIEQFHLYLVSDGQKFDELDDDKTVEDCKIKEDDKLYLLSYMWSKKMKVTVKKTGTIVRGCEQDDTCLGVKVKAQDQLGTPISTFILVRMTQHQLGENPLGKPYHPNQPHDYIRKFKQLIEIGNEKIPFNYKESLFIVTEEELEADPARLEEEVKTWREEVRQEHNRPDKKNRIEERRKLGYVYSSIRN